MTKKERAQFVKNELEKLYPEVTPPLNFSDHYTLLVAVLLSAQCTDERVNQVTPKLFELASNPQDMMNQREEEIYNIIRPCGLAPRKSKSILELSKILVQKHQGQVPNNFEDLEALPGVGHKTASVVMTQGFGVPSFPVDTHIHRLAFRWGLSKGENVKSTEADLKEIFDKKNWAKLHLQIIYYGREYCQARKCYGLTCPICHSLYPKRRKKLDNPKT